MLSYVLSPVLISARTGTNKDDKVAIGKSHSGGPMSFFLCSGSETLCSHTSQWQLPEPPEDELWDWNSKSVCNRYQATTVNRTGCCLSLEILTLPLCPSLSLSLASILLTSCHCSYTHFQRGYFYACHFYACHCHCPVVLSIGGECFLSLIFQVLVVMRFKCVLSKPKAI